MDAKRGFSTMDSTIDDRGRAWRKKEHDTVQSCMRCWIFIVLAGDVFGLCLSVLVMLGGFYVQYGGAMIFAFSNVVAAVISLVAVCRYLCCSMRGPKTSKSTALVLIAALGISFIACFLLLFPGEPCKRVSSFCIDACTKCGTTYSCSDGVDKGKGSKCRVDNATDVQNCGDKWCAHFDEDCGKAAADDSWYWGFDSEDSCVKDYGDLSDYMAAVFGIGLFAGVLNVATRAGAVISAFRCSDDEEASSDAGQTQQPNAKVVQGEVVQHSELVQHSVDDIDVAVEQQPVAASVPVFQ